MRVLIDTHIFVWAQLEPARLTGPARDLLDRADTAVAMSALTLYELSVLLERRRVAVNLPPETWIREALARSGVELLPVTEAIAYRARSLPGYPAQDPFDRMIIATALEHGLPLVTADEVMRGWAGLPIIW